MIPGPEVFSLPDADETEKTGGDSRKAVLLYKHALAIREKALGADHPAAAQSLNCLAVLYDAQGKYGDAEQLFKRSLAILVKARGRNHSDVDEVLRNYWVLLRKMNSGDEATRPEARAKDVHKKANLK